MGGLTSNFYCILSVKLYILVILVSVTDVTTTIFLEYHSVLEIENIQL